MTNRKSFDDRNQVLSYSIIVISGISFLFRNASKVVVPETKQEIYKSTLVSLLNEDPKLSKDR